MFDKKPLDKYDYAFTSLDLDAVGEFLNSDFVYNPLDDKLEIELENRGLREIFLFYNPDYLYFTAKTLLNIELYPLQCVTLEMLFKYPFPMLIGSRGFSKTWLLAVYLTLRCILFPGTKAVVAGAAFRQSKYVFEYVKKLWDNAPILQSIYKGRNPYKQLPDIWRFSLGSSEMMFIPIGMGETIRGLRANVLAVDEFNSASLEVYEVVLSQFTSVSMNPIENLKQIAKRKAMLAAGLEVEEEMAKLSYFNNQSIISGTLKFSFDPLAIYWKKYKDLIESKGQRLEEIFGDIGKNLNWRDFAVIRVPYECIPEGFMDDKVVARARATMHTDYYQAEYGCVPISDTTGFYKRSLIESCTATNKNILSENWPSWCLRSFEAKIRGEKDCKYVMGIDPASEQDNFCIVILELKEEHQRLVYCWTTTREIFKQQNLGDDKNYYGFCVRKIRSLMKQFYEIVAIGCDSQGGGYAIEEGLHDTDKLSTGEVSIWPIIEDKEKDTDSYAGQHILHMINFASSEWVSNSNHGMKKDMQDKLLLFPQFNAVLLGIASEKDMAEIKLSDNPMEDTLENCMLEIELLKDELSIISRTRTVAGRERWDTPEIKVGRNKKDKLRKDRYSALLIANAVARTIHRAPPDIQYNCIGSAVGDKNLGIRSNQMYVGNEWYNVSPKLFRGITK